MKRNKPDKLTRIFLQNYATQSRFAEAYRTLRTNVHFSFMEKEYQTILLTSAGQGEGKTSTSANMAHTMAQSGKKVMIIDADLRKPRIHELVPSNTSPGLSGLLADLLSTGIAEGSLTQYSVTDLYRLMYLQNKSGYLKLEDEDERLELLFFQGQLVDLNWLTRPEGKKLAAILVKNGALTQKQAQLALSRQKDTGQKLAFMLINLGMLDESQIVGPLKIQMLEGLRIGLQMKAGRFSFQALSETELERTSFDPIDFHKLYKQLLVGGETLPFLQEAIHSAIIPSGTENLHLLPAGHLPPNPSELIGSKRMRFLLAQFKKRFDIIIIDTSPILPASDALMLAPMTDGVVLIVKPGIMNRNLVKKAVEQLRTAKANLIGVVLNNVDTRRESYYKYYHKYYSQYYGKQTA